MDYPRVCPARWLSDQGFGMFMPHEFLYPPSYLTSRKWHNQYISKEFNSTIENEKNEYKITMDIQHFLPEDISVKVNENEIIVEGKHEDRQDSHGYISRQFKRRYELPKDCPPENVVSTLSSDGILTIIAEKRSSNVSEKKVPIKLCGIHSNKTEIKSTISSEITELNDMSKKSAKNTQILKEDHSRLLKPELYKETSPASNRASTATESIMEINSAVSKESGNQMRERKEEITEKKKEMAELKAAMSEKKESKDEINVGATTSRMEESMATRNLGLSQLAEQLRESNVASTLEMAGMKGISETRIEESSSFMSSSSMSTMKASGKINERISDIISEELKEAAENL